MTTTPIKLFAVAFLSTIGTALSTTSNAPEIELDQIARYRQWTRATQKLNIAPSVDISSVTGAI